MKKRERHYIRALIIVMILTLFMPLVSCEKKPTNSDTTDGNTSVGTETGSEESVLALENYVIIRGEKADTKETVAAVRLRDAIRDKTGVELEIREDYIKGSKPSDTDVETDEAEILVGKTNRKQTHDVIGDFNLLDYAVAVRDNKLVVAGGSPYATEKAVQMLIDSLIEPEGAVPEQYEKIVRFYEPGNVPYVLLNEYVIIGSEHVGQHEQEAIMKLHAFLKDSTGKEPSVKGDRLTGVGNYARNGVSEAKEILVGQTNRVESTTLIDELGYMDYAIQIAENKVIIAGGSSFATQNAMNQFIEDLRGGKIDSLQPGKYEFRYEFPREYHHPLASNPDSFVPVWADSYQVPAWMTDFDEKLYAMTAPGKRLLSTSHRADQVNYPENSIEAILSAIMAGADYVEMDIRLTKDYIPVLMHDTTLERTTDWSEKAGKNGLPSSKFLTDWTYEELRSLRLKMQDGTQTDYVIPLFYDAVAVCAGRTQLDLDEKIVVNYYRDIYPAASRLGPKAKASFLKKISSSQAKIWMETDPEDTVFTNYAMTYYNYLELPGHSAVTRYYPNLDNGPVWYETPEMWQKCFDNGRYWLFSNNIVPYCKFIAENFGPANAD